MKRSANRYVEVLLTYLRRPMFLALGLWIVLCEAELYCIQHFDNDPSFGRWRGLGDYLPILVFCSCLFLPSVIGSAIVFHAREQLANWRNTLTPGYRTPHLVIAGAAFTGALLLLMVVFIVFSVDQPWFELISFSLLMISMLLTAGAFWWAFRSTWLLLILGLLAFAAPLQVLRQQEFLNYETFLFAFNFLSVPVSLLIMAIVLWTKRRSIWISGFLGLLAIGYFLLYLHFYDIYVFTSHNFYRWNLAYYLDSHNFFVWNFAHWSAFISTLVLIGAFWMVFRSSGISLLLGSLTVAVPLFVIQICIATGLIILNIDDLNGLVYPFLIVCALMIASGWWASFRSLWISFLLGPLMIVVPLLIMNEIINHFARSNSDVERISDSVGNLFLEFFPPLLIAAFIALGWKLAKGSRRTGKTSRRFMGKGVAISETTMKPVLRTTTFVHRPVIGFWTRSRRRRVSVLGPGATWAMAGFLAVALTLLAKMFLTLSDVPYDGQELLIHMSLILITITPAIAITLIWRERLPFLAAESLYPAARRKFIWEMAAVLANDFVLFWLATTAAALVPLAYFAPELFKAHTFWICVAATAIMQMLAYGTIACAMSFRSWVLMVVATLIILGWMVYPIESAMTGMNIGPDLSLDMLDVNSTLVTSLVIGGIGVILALVAYYRWRRIELA